MSRKEKSSVTVAPRIRGATSGRVVAPKKEKLSVTLDRSLVAQIRTQAGDRGVSEWLNDAALLRLQGENLARLMVSHGITLDGDLLREVEAEWPRG